MKRSLGLIFLLAELSLYAGCFPRGTPVWVIVNDVCQNVANVSSQIDGLDLCGFTPIGQADLLITTSGNYCLMQDVVGTVTIADSYVHLDLNGHTIDGGLQGVLVQTNLHDISVANGIIQNTLEEGVLVQDGCERIDFSDLRVIGCAQNTDLYGIYLDGDVKLGVSDCTINDVLVSQCSNGVRITNGRNNKVSNVRVTELSSSDSVIGISISDNCMSNILSACFVSTMSSFGSFAQGVLLNDAENTSITDVKVVNLVGDSEVYGFVTRNCSGTSLKNCYAGDIEAYGSAIFGGAGYWIESDENYRIVDCISRGLRGKTYMLGMLVLGTQKGEIRSCSISDVFTDGESGVAYGFIVATLGERSVGILVDDITVQNIRSVNAESFGFSVNEETSNMVISNCSVQDVFGSGKTYGFFITDVPGVSITNCTAINVSDLNPISGSAKGFEVSSLSCGMMRNCISTNVSTLNGSTSGFHFTGLFKFAVQNCVSSCVKAVNGGAVGIFIEGASVLTLTGCESFYNETVNTAMTASGFMVPRRHSEIGCIF